jgi:purine-binding chemotaxis protein CheW
MSGVSQRSLWQILAFEIGHQRFGISVGDVNEIVQAVATTKLPYAPAVVEGVINLRGKVLPVLDIRARFRLPPKSIDPADHLVIARAQHRLVAIRVDRVVDLLTLRDDEIAEMVSVAPTSAYVAGVAKLPDGLVLIHDLTTFLSEAEANAIDEFEEHPS